MDKIYIVMNYVEHDLKSLMETMKQPFLPGSKTSVSLTSVFVELWIKAEQDFVLRMCEVCVGWCVSVVYPVSSQQLFILQVKWRLWWFSCSVGSDISTTTGFSIVIWRRPTCCWATRASWRSADQEPSVSLSAWIHIFIWGQQKLIISVRKTFFASQ